MKFTEFIDRVQQQLEPEEREVATRLVEATFSTLGERLSTPQRTKLAAQLPDELKRLLYRHQRTRRFDLEDFFKRVASRADIGYGRATKEARIVVGVLEEAVSEGEIEGLISQLPDEYKILFGKKSPDSLSAAGD